MESLRCRVLLKRIEGVVLISRRLRNLLLKAVLVCVLILTVPHFAATNSDAYRSLHGHMMRFRFSWMGITRKPSLRFVGIIKNNYGH